MNDIQKTILAIFKEVKKVCENNNIPYYAIGGTCIGAARHKGFIPWDDDLDIAVPIEDFDRLRDALQRELPEYYSIHDSRNKKQYHYVFMKVEDDRTTYIQNSMRKFKDGYMGVFVDIMPISGVPTGMKERMRFYHCLKYLEIFNIVRRFPVWGQTSPKGKAAALLLKLPMHVLLRKDSFSRMYLNLLKKHPVSKAEYVGYVWYPAGLPAWTFPAEWFSKTVNLQFEDTEISCPWKYHEYLTQQFGDYMTPPPIEDQVYPHEGVIDLEHSYKEYQIGSLQF